MRQGSTGGWRVMLKAVLGFGLGCGAGARAAAPVAASTPASSGVASGASTAKVTAEGDDILLPNAKIAEDTGQLYEHMFTSVGAGPRYSPQVGGVQFQFPEDLVNSGFHYSMPFVHPSETGAPEAGLPAKFYFNISGVSASLFYTDNANLSEHNRRDRVTSVVRTSGAVYLQLLDALRFAAEFEVVYYPIEGRLGLSGFMRDSLAARSFVDVGRSLRAQLAYGPRIGNWDLLIYDQIRSQQTLFSEHLGLDTTMSITEEDRVGRFASTSNNTRSGAAQYRVNETSQDTVNTVFALNNMAGVTASRMLPTETQMSLGAYRMDYWYVNSAKTMLPHSRELAFATLRNQRESLRFRPFITYQVSRFDQNPWDQEIHGGIYSPLSENISFTGSIGYFIGGRTNEKRFLANARIQHNINPTTYYYLQYNRDVTEPVQDLQQSYTFDLNHIFSDYLRGDLFASYSTFESLSKTINTGTRETRVGAMFTANVSSKMSLHFGAVYHHVTYDNSDVGQFSRWSAVAQSRYRLTETLDGSITYQYQTRDSSVPNDNYDQDIVYLTLTKRFH